MKVLIIVCAIIAIVMSSCTKDPVTPAPVETSATSPLRTRDGKDEEDRPIVIHKAFDEQFRPLAGATLTFTCDTAVRTAHSDETGSTIIVLPHKGTWVFQISKESYASIFGELVVADSVTERTDTLIKE